ncbi:serine carboxypeptidase [Lentinus tigrinus ALCF2SS1-6]|uniref:Carboxypeptidase n=1 Tax=Lentinus tigrinus ALCF2SS1-6 TaxID=1328759 RepID=A0A5C2S0X1_9APHY|nr:serine carboxypeptidase [Lentinus tigrinus ALCF2SS1-6]
MKFPAWWGLVLNGLVTSTTARISQEHFLAPTYQVGSSPSTPYNEGLFTPVEDLHILSTSEYTSLRHPSLPQYNVRIKQSQFCDGEVQAYTGYIDIEARHLFFYFFESRRDPDKDDVVFWTNGGPGGSSSLGLFMELGPCRVTSANSTKRFEHAWNDHANVFFIDQPVGVGFSYAEYGEQVSSTSEAAKDISAFMVIFFEHFSKFKGRPFHMAGESYGGRYIPVFASAVYDRNAELIEAGLTPINITSVMIGNGCTDFAGVVRSYYDIQCGDYGFPAVTSISDCVRMKQLLPRCQKRFQESCIDVTDKIDCASAWEFCWKAFDSVFLKYNAYDALRPCKGHADMTSCYPIVRDIGDYLTNRTVQSVLGVDPHSNFSLINFELNERFSEDSWSFRAEHYLAALLERRIRALVYVGDTDWICNWVGNERMTLNLEWTGQKEYQSRSLREWYIDGDVAGKTRSFGPLTFATIRDAGHMAPYDQPVRSLELANRWLAGAEF